MVKYALKIFGKNLQLMLDISLGDTGRYYLDIDWKSVYIKDI